jgi:hypothetical protein
MIITAAFMDIFGLIGFVILFITGISMRKISKVKIQAWVMITISSIGIIADSFSILTNYILRG